MIKWIAGLLFTALAALPAQALDLDKYIADTNVIVGAGGEDFCSGTVISIKERLILTANHCIDQQLRAVTEEVVDPNTGEITKRTVQKREPMEISMRKVKDYEIVGSTRYLANIKAYDRDHDVAILQVVDETFTPVAEARFAGGATPKRGDTIYLIGNPGIQFDSSVSKGIVSAPERTLNIDGKKLRVFQTDAAAIGGNSGGQAINELGEIVGTVSAALRTSTMSFVVPVSFTKELLKKNGLMKSE